MNLFKTDYGLINFGFFEFLFYGLIIAQYINDTIISMVNYGMS